MLAADYRGLSVKQIAELRGRLRGDARMTVVKNTLARRAAEEAGRAGMVPHLIGPTAVVWIEGDPAAAAKALVEFNEEFDTSVSVKGGLLRGQELSQEQFIALSKLPPREELMAKLVGGVAAPLNALGNLNQPLQKLGNGMNELLAGLGRTLTALEAQKASAGS
jgi:large subunit ribosomal protein L10